MTEKLRDYSVNGAMIIGVDNGYGNMKTARRCFKTALVKYDSAPVLSRDYLEYDGKFYVIGEGHKGFVADKQSDEDNYILTLAAIAKELEARGMKNAVNTARVHLVMPQCYSAVAENLKDFKGITLLADIGNGTMNLMYLNNGRPMESKAWTEKLGVFQCYQKIHNLVQDNTGECLMEEVIESFLRTGETDLPEKYAELMKQATVTYTEEIMQKLQDHEFNGELMRVYFMGGGARLVEQFGKYNPERTVFNHDIRANAKGYEYYCYMLLRHQNQRK